MDVYEWITEQQEGLYETAAAEVARVQKILHRKHRRQGEAEPRGELRVRVRRTREGVFSVEWLVRKWWTTDGKKRFRTSYIRKGNGHRVPSINLERHAWPEDLEEILAAAAVFAECRRRARDMKKTEGLLKKLGFERFF